MRWWTWFSVAIEVELDKALLRPTDVPLTMGDARRAKELLGWEPSIPWGHHTP